MNVPATGRGPDALYWHIAEQHDIACKLTAALEAISYLDNDGAEANAVTALIGIAHDLASEIYRGLDIVTLDKVERVGQ